MSTTPDYIKSLEKNETTSKYQELQSKVNVTNRDVYEMTDHGKYRAERREKLEEIEGLNYENKKSKSAAKRAAGVGFGSSLGHYGGEVVQIVKPSFPAVNNAITTNLSIFAENNFVKEFGGKGGENIKDMMYRATGKTLAEVKKAKEKAENAEKEAKAMRANAQAIADALSGKK